MERKHPILEEIEVESKRGNSFFNLASNSIDVYLAVGFTLSFTIFAQAYFLKNWEKILETGFLSFLLYCSAIMSIFIFSLIIFQVYYWRKKADDSKKRQLFLAKQYVDF